MQIEAEELTEHGIRPTSVRILVMRAIMQRKGAFCLYDIEADVPTLDRSSIFRALRLFTQHHLLHEIDDGSGFCQVIHMILRKVLQLNQATSPPA